MKPLIQDRYKPGRHSNRGRLQYKYRYITILRMNSNIPPDKRGEYTAIIPVSLEFEDTVLECVFRRRT